MELRDIEIFLTLAEELHFGRTAVKLHLTQARVSQSIKKQERGLGAPLFERDSRNVRLTPVGVQLRDDLRPLYDGLRRSVDRARLAGQGKIGELKVGFINSNVSELRPYWDAFRSRHPQWDLRLRHNGFLEPFEPLRRGEIDVLCTWLPVEERDLIVGPEIYIEPRVMAVRPEHRLAGEKSVSFEILGDGPVVQGPELPDYWEDAFLPFSTLSGRPVERTGHPIENLEDLFYEVLEAGKAHPFAAHAARYNVRSDVVYIPVIDALPLRWGLVWREETEPVKALADIVRELGPMEP